MPWDNVPESKWPEMESCVKDVMAQGKDKEAATAICYNSVVEGKELLKAIKEYDESQLTDAEVLRIDQLYLDVQSGKVTLPEPETEKASVSGGRGTPTVGTPTTGTPTSGGVPGYVDGKRKTCVLRLKKLGVDEAMARKVCSHALSGAEQKAAQKDATFTVFKQANGKHRWLMITSSSFQDRDKEIVSQKALEDDTDRMNTNGQYGPLDWWHTPIQLGTCDFSAMHGKLSIESGEIADPLIGTKLAEQQADLAASRAFYHPITEPDAQGVYSHIQTFSRAILPKAKASNLLTQVLLVREEKQMLQEKIKELIARLGGDKVAEEKVSGLLAQAEAVEKAAEAQGIAFKEQQPPSVATPPPEKKEEPPAEKKEEKGWFVGDMKPEEFIAAIAKGVEMALAPGLTQIKEAQTQAIQQGNAATLIAIKQIADAQVATAKEFEKTAQAVKELNGLTPRGFRPSQDASTVTEKNKGAPGPDERSQHFANFISNMVLGQQATPQPPTK